MIYCEISIIVHTILDILSYILRFETAQKEINT